MPSLPHTNFQFYDMNPGQGRSGKRDFRKENRKKKRKEKKGHLFFFPHLVKSLGKTVYFGMMEKKACWCISLDPVIS